MKLINCKRVFKKREFSNVKLIIPPAINLKDCKICGFYPKRRDGVNHKRNQEGEHGCPPQESEQLTLGGAKIGFRRSAP